MPRMPARCAPGGSLSTRRAKVVDIYYHLYKYYLGPAAEKAGVQLQAEAKRLNTQLESKTRELDSDTKKSREVAEAFRGVSCGGAGFFLIEGVQTSPFLGTGPAGSFHFMYGVTTPLPSVAPPGGGEWTSGIGRP